MLLCKYAHCLPVQVPILGTVGKDSDWKELHEAEPWHLPASTYPYSAYVGTPAQFLTLASLISYLGIQENVHF